MSELFGYLLIDKHLFVWLHVLFGIAWIGLLYYFNFIQGGYFKAASPEALADAKAKLAPEALWWFRWAAMFTFITGLILLHLIQQQLNNYIAISALMGTLMFLNVFGAPMGPRDPWDQYKKIENRFFVIFLMLNSILLINDTLTLYFDPGTYLEV